MFLTEFTESFDREKAFKECRALVDSNNKVSNRDLFLLIRDVIWLRREDWSNAFRADMPFRIDDQLGRLNLGYIPPEDHPLNQQFMSIFSPEIIPAGTPIGHPYYDAVVVNVDSINVSSQSFGVNRYRSSTGRTRFICKILVAEDLKFILAGKHPLDGGDREIAVHLERDQGMAIAKNIWENHLRYPENLPTDKWGEAFLWVRNSVGRQSINPN